MVNLYLTITRGVSVLEAECRAGLSSYSSEGVVSSSFCEPRTGCHSAGSPTPPPWPVILYWINLLWLFFFSYLLFYASGFLSCWGGCETLGRLRKKVPSSQ